MSLKLKCLDMTKYELGYDFTPLDRFSYDHFDEIIKWMEDNFDNSDIWYVIGKELTVINNLSAMLVKLRFDTKHRGSLYD